MDPQIHRYLYLSSLVSLHLWILTSWHLLGTSQDSWIFISVHPGICLESWNLYIHRSLDLHISTSPDHQNPVYLYLWILGAWYLNILRSWHLYIHHPGIISFSYLYVHRSSGLSISTSSNLQILASPYP